MPTFSQLRSAADDNLKVWFTCDTLQVLCAWNPTSVCGYIQDQQDSKFCSYFLGKI
jgi:hypothetical protein